MVTATISQTSPLPTSASSQPTSVSNQLLQQWQNPSDIFSLLLLVGGDVILKAFAQFHGRSFRPVAFSFGWVAYAFSALLASVGHLKVMPEPDCPSTLIQCGSGSGQRLENQSWLLGRLVRSSRHWLHPDSFPPARLDDAGNEMREPLPIYIFRADGEKYSSFAVDDKERGLSSAGQRGTTRVKMGMDLVWLSGIATSVIQLGIAAIPAGLYKEWEILLITFCGTAMAFGTGFLHEWAQGGTAKFRIRTNATYALLKGSGPGEVFIIINSEYGINLLDFASVEDKAGISAVFVSAILLVLWTALLITVSGLKSHTWYIVAIGSIGMLQNTIVAGAPRAPAALGIYLLFQEKIAEPKVMTTLQAVEEKYPGVGIALLPIMFPGTLRPHERAYWGEKAEALERMSAARRGP
jgi:hypothetical protein